ncbi:hypothetical protein TTHERM_00162860 (macronuclear) [Tetrahymena thermophila SB210]|uniref:Kinase domain protein n=1 Tax=Tetrahymena thermophila (strain SB210) TaxID=312017 RepID=Q22TP4_TETTS|nr:hypothetical protein TTHERM_00162860 [Tetrahymena thermophila SB210]EAR88394.2 hypothetical protein TTHERM_00162860 [Tetrahymena thermophila SB210]|eukprot:XP_001008639.2 hypothetical protein TTHERM_00162860 [Tetrahymena thermophila SB210]
MEFYSSLASCQNLQTVTFDLRYIENNNDEKIQAFNIQNLQYQNMIVLSINMSSCSLTQFQAFDLGLVQNLTSLNINLSNNKLSKFEELAAGLEKCLHLQNLDLNLSNNQIEKEAAQSIIQSITHIQNIRILKLDFSNTFFKLIDFNVLEGKCEKITLFSFLFEQQSLQYNQQSAIRLDQWLTNCMYLSTLKIYPTYRHSDININKLKRKLKRFVANK